MTPQIEFLLYTGFHILFYLVTLIFVIFSVFTVYHWFTYGSSKHLSTLSLGVYLLVAAPLFMTMSVLLSLM